MSTPPNRTENLGGEPVSSLDTIERLGETMRMQRTELERLLDANDALRRTAFNGLANMQALFKARDEELQNEKNPASSRTPSTDVSQATCSLEAKLDQLGKELLHERECKRRYQDECISMRKELQKVEAELVQFQSTFGTNLTPRLILAGNILSHQHLKKRNEEEHDVSQFNKYMRLRTRLPLVPILTPNLLDVSLSPEISLRLSREIGPHPNQANLLEQTFIQTCDGCHKGKFRQTSTITYRTIAEFPEISSPTSCCSKFICSECLVDHLASSLNTGLWDCSRSHLRLKCPGGCLNGSIAIYNRHQWGEVFQHMPAEAKKTSLAE